MILTLSGDPYKRGPGFPCIREIPLAGLDEVDYHVRAPVRGLRGKEL